MEQGSFLFAETPTPVPAVIDRIPALHYAPCRPVTAANPSMLVPWVLSAAYAYAYSYLDALIISDALYDQLSIELAWAWDQVRHVHKGLLSRDWFPKGAIFLPREGFPKRIEGATIRLLQRRNGI